MNSKMYHKMANKARLAHFLIELSVAVVAGVNHTLVNVSKKNLDMTVTIRVDYAGDTYTMAIETDGPKQMNGGEAMLLSVLLTEAAMLTWEFRGIL